MSVLYDEFITRRNSEKFVSAEDFLFSSLRKNKKDLRALKNFSRSPTFI